MARQLAHYVDPEEEERRARLLAEAFDMTTPRLTDRAYPQPTDAWSTGEPTPEELAADEEHEAGEFGPIAELEPRVAPQREKLAPASNFADDYLWADELLKNAPAAVDKTSAVVPAAQKGTPAKNPDDDPAIALSTDITAEQDYANQLRQHVQQNVIGRPPLSETPLHQQAAQVASDAMLPAGERFRDERAARARAAYGEESGPSTRWEDEFTSSHKRLTDKDVERAFLLQSLMWGNDQGMKFREMQRREQAGYEEGIAKARDKDRANTRISRGMAEAIAATGQVSPEEAVNLTYGDPLVKNFGQYASQGGRAEGQILGREKLVASHARELYKLGVIDDRQYDQMMTNAATQMSVRGAGINRMPTQVEMEAMGSVMGQALKALGPISKDAGIRAMQGDYSKLNPEQADLAQTLAPQILSKAMSKNGLDTVLTDSIRTQATQPIKDRYSIDKSLQVARNDPDYKMEFENKWEDAQTDFTAAWEAWDSLDHRGKQLFSEWAGSGWTKDVRAAIGQVFGDNPDPELGNKFAAVQGAINALVKDRSGSAVTGSEWERIASELNIEADNWGPFNSSGAITNWLERSGRKLIQHRRRYEAEYGWGAVNGGQ